MPDRATTLYRLWSDPRPAEPVDPEAKADRAIALDRKFRTSRPGRLWLFTHSAAATGDCRG
jgi:hypothetical protein